MERVKQTGSSNLRASKIRFETPLNVTLKKLRPELPKNYFPHPTPKRPFLRSIFEDNPSQAFYRRLSTTHTNHIDAN